MKFKKHRLFEAFTSRGKASCPGANASEGMERVKKLMSPGSKRRFLSGGTNKQFGTPLEELMRKHAHTSGVPTVVHRLCEYLEHFGLDYEGVFRVNGNVRVMDKLKVSFDTTGDADLEAEDDVAAAAGTLKQFLREMPEGVVPQNLTFKFIAIQQAHGRDESKWIDLFRQVLCELPYDNYNLLRYLVRFLVLVTSREDQNKMSPMALGIVFGPGLFRTQGGVEALRYVGAINEIGQRIISYYDRLFLEDSSEDMAEAGRSSGKKVPPPRPPPPKVQAQAEDVRPLPSPRKSKMQHYDSSLYSGDGDDGELSVGDATPHSGSSRLHDDTDYSADCTSPFNLDEGMSVMDSPVATARTTELVERVITETISEHIFGDDKLSPDKSSSSGQTSPNLVNSFSKESFDSNLTASSMHTESEDGDFGRAVSLEASPTALLPPSALTSSVGSQDSATGPKGGATTELVMDVEDLLPADGEVVLDSMTNGDEHCRQDFEGVERKGEMLQHKYQRMMKSPRFIKQKSGGPPRRMPSRKFRQSQDAADLDSQIQELLQETAIVITNGGSSGQQPSAMEAGEEGTQDVNHNQTKSKLPTSDPPPQSSPNNARKPFIPPLDLSILHEHVDGSEPIPARKLQTTLYETISNHQPPQRDPNQNIMEESPVILSPRSAKLKKRNGWVALDDVDTGEAPLSPSAYEVFESADSVAANTDIPPSPPVEQDHYRKHSSVPGDDELSQKMRQTTKKIQALKKKIKLFEEQYEREHGYKPSHGEKASRPDVKKYMSELSRHRKDLKRLKEEAEMGTRSRHGSGASSSGERSDPLVPSMQDTLDNIQHSLAIKREEAERPEEILLMRREQVQEEKLAVQKALLHFESIHGRPSTKNEKDLMRPLYDRYRTIKRILAKQPSSPRDTMELETVPEDQPIEIMSGSTAGTKFRNPIRVPYGEAEDGEGENEEFGTGDFLVTRDPTALREAISAATAPFLPDDEDDPSPKVKKKESLIQMHQQLSSESNLHELTLPELHDELGRSKSEKKRLRKILRDFEEDFQSRNARRVQKEDRLPFQSEYNMYKQLKARMRLLDALISKHQQQSEV